MSDLKAAADEGKKLVKMFHSVSVVIEALDKIADIESYIAEIEGRLAKARDAELAEINKRDAIVREAEETASRIRAETKKADDKMQHDMEKAKAELSAIQAKTKDMVSDFDRMQAAYKNKMGSMAVELSNVEAAIVQRNKDLVELNNKISKVKAEAIKMLG